MITDLTRMGGDRVCVAGITSDGQCIRPCLSYDNLTEAWLWDGQTLVVRPFAVVELELLSPKPAAPYTEDWLIDGRYRVLKGAKAQHERLDALTRICDENVASIFGTPIQFRDYKGVRESCWIPAGSGTRSLGTIGPVEPLQVVYGMTPYNKWEYRLSFVDQDGQGYRLAVVDLAFRRILESLHHGHGIPPQRAAATLLGNLSKGEVYLRIGLARAYPENQCYLQVTGVYSFPDYLDGRSFADFREGS